MRVGLNRSGSVSSHAQAILRALLYGSFYKFSDRDEIRVRRRVGRWGFSTVTVARATQRRALRASSKI